MDSKLSMSKEWNMMAGKRQKNPVWGYKRRRDGPTLSHSCQDPSWNIQLSSESHTLKKVLANWTHSEERDLESTRPALQPTSVGSANQYCLSQVGFKFRLGSLRGWWYHPWRPEIQPRHRFAGPREATDEFSLGRVRLKRLWSIWKQRCQVEK